MQGKVLCKLTFAWKENLQGGAQFFLLLCGLLVAAREMLCDHHGGNEQAADTDGIGLCVCGRCQRDTGEEREGDNAPFPCGVDLKQRGQQDIQSSQYQHHVRAGEKTKKHAKSAGDAFAALLMAEGSHCVA